MNLENCHLDRKRTVHYIYLASLFDTENELFEIVETNY